MPITDDDAALRALRTALGEYPIRQPGGAPLIFHGGRYSSLAATV